MRSRERQKIKEARILKYWEELTRLRLDPDASLELISYIFAIDEAWIMKIIKKDASEYGNIKIPHIDLEIQLIEAYYDKIKVNAQEQRQKAVQGKLF